MNRKQSQWALDFLNESNEDEAAFAMIIARPLSIGIKRAPRRSQPGRAPNKKRDPHRRHLRLLQQYFGPEPVYNEYDFRRCFRITPRLFSNIHMSVVQHDSYFAQKPDATGKMGISSLIKVTAALRVLAYSASADSIDENLEIAATTVSECVQRFCNAVIAVFGPEFLTPPNAEELEQLLNDNGKRGFVGMIGSNDCMHWQWKNCPSAHAGQHKGKEKKPTKVLETIADRNLRIWHCFFGSPGSMNDINILDQSNAFDSILKGENVQTEYFIGGKNLLGLICHYMFLLLYAMQIDTQFNLPYVLADGIYPEWAVFVKTIEKPMCPKKKYFAKHQESCRKDVERCFGVLQARWCILDTPCRLWSPTAMSSVMHACIILHNMIIVDELDDSRFQGHNHLFEEENQPGGALDFRI